MAITYRRQTGHVLRRKNSFITIQIVSYIPLLLVYLYRILERVEEDKKVFLIVWCDLDVWISTLFSKINRLLLKLCSFPWLATEEGKSLLTLNDTIAVRMNHKSYHYNKTFILIIFLVN